MNKEMLTLILKALQALLDTSITPKEIPQDKYLKPNSWMKIDRKRREYIQTITNEIDTLIGENKGVNK